MANIQQAMRLARVATPFGDDTLALAELKGTERLSTLYSYEIDCVSENFEIDLYELLGQNVTVEFEVEGGELRFINGVVAHARHASSRGEYACYQFTLRPWLWLLGRTSDCRIFAEMSVVDILEQVFSDNGHSDVENRLMGSYPKWNYCVQYQESDLAFVSRLMEHEGIYYYFEHQDGKNMLILCDGSNAHNTVPGSEEIPHYPAGTDQAREKHHFVSWEFQRHISSGKYVLNDFGFDDPGKDLVVSAVTKTGDAYDSFELYEYPSALPNTDGGGLERSYGETLVKRRMEEEVSLHETFMAVGNVRALNAGNIFSLTECERKNQNREYLVIHCQLEVSLDSFFSGEGNVDAEFKSTCKCIESKRPFRAARTTPKPRIQGPQTAIVVGPGGEEIWTDMHGRIKLQFHWDRYGQSDENSSRWVRVSQVWAGEKWGAIHIPRIGQEVIVEYIDGDPDRPIVTGRVYNGQRPVPYDLPGNATQSGIKSRSSKGGSPANFNEIRMEDKMGSEELYIHAEKNQTNIVENDESTSVGHDRSENVGNDETIAIGNNRSEEVAVDETISIGNNRTESVGANEDISIGANRSESVAIDETVTIGGSRSVTIGMSKTETVTLNKAESIGVAKQLSIGGRHTVSVGGAVDETYGSNQTTNVSGDHKESIGKGQSITIGKDQDFTIGDNQNFTIGKNQKFTIADDLTITSGKNIVIDAADSITLKTGSASITMKKDGTIDIVGKDIKVKGSGAIDINASNNIVMKGQKILQN